MSADGRISHSRWSRVDSGSDQEHRGLNAEGFALSGSATPLIADGHIEFGMGPGDDFDSGRWQNASFDITVEPDSFDLLPGAVASVAGSAASGLNWSMVDIAVVTGDVSMEATSSSSSCPWTLFADLHWSYRSYSDKGEDGLSGCDLEPVAGGFFEVRVGPPEASPRWLRWEPGPTDCDGCGPLSSEGEPTLVYCPMLGM